MINTKVKVKSNEAVKVNTASEISKGAIITLSLTGALIGTWSLACLVGGMITAGSPFALISAWFTAVSF